MRLADLVTLERVQIEPTVSSKKRALETLGELLAGADGESAAGPAPHLVFDALSARERLGSTGLGHGVAIPHGRMAQLDTPRVAVLRVDQGVDFDAIDHEPVDILIALVVPEASTSDHLELLAQLARALSQPDNIAAMRRAVDPPGLQQAATAAFHDA
ncbi:PTS sugar transporter subunit IIA [Thioalkalivibrio paradoxus]|uniref:PTS sugar transporter subunit IIA n=1 Tax=Thioalkalivibrio paradoxus ARh 1 TaxID=713585 RepID=W0DPZ4_9GAMM|nr:PTS sugar transporter subunit IIA [Thioalkalivibrio paradoxus]AHE99312.1 PTS sugar transporter subunit IIA [Thioalkalivibrio paradoxus ARh 1]